VSVRIEVRYEGELHTTATHGPSGAVLATDAPKDNEGKGESFSPTDLLATALGTCMLTVMGILARRKGWDMAGARVSVDKHMVADPVRRVGRLDLRFEMPPGLPAESHKLLERAAHTCPVHQSLHPDVKVETLFSWGTDSKV
jgi:putative redox protein